MPRTIDPDYTPGDDNYWSYDRAHGRSPGSVYNNQPTDLNGIWGQNTPASRGIGQLGTDTTSVAAPAAPSATLTGGATPMAANGPATGGVGGFGFTNLASYLYANPSGVGPGSGYAPTPTGFQASDYNAKINGYSPNAQYTAGMAGVDNALNAAYGRVANPGPASPPPPPPPPSGSGGPGEGTGSGSGGMGDGGGYGAGGSGGGGMGPGGMGGPADGGGPGGGGGTGGPADGGGGGPKGGPARTLVTRPGSFAPRNMNPLNQNRGYGNIAASMSRQRMY